MTVKTATQLKANFLGQDPNDWITDLVDSVAKALGLQTNAALVVAEERTFTENGAGTYTGAVELPAGATLLDIVVHNDVLWAAATSATMKVGDTDDDGYYTGVNLKATDLLANESLSFAREGGKGGAYYAGTGTHWTNRYSAAARTINGIITSVGAGTAGRTRMVVLYVLPTAVAATKV